MYHDYRLETPTSILWNLAGTIVKNITSEHIHKLYVRKELETISIKRNNA